MITAGTKKKIPTYLIAASLLSVALFLLSLYRLPAPDWRDFIKPGIQELLAGRSPFNIGGFVYPPWSAVMLVPLVYLPENLARAILAVTTVGSVMYAARFYKAGMLSTLILLISPPVVQAVLYGTIDWMPILGLTLPGPIGLIFLLVKPQLGIGVGLFWAVEAWRKNGWKGVFQLLWPVTLVVAASFLVFGFWVKYVPRGIPLGRSMSMWPMSVPIGLVLLYKSIRNRSANLALGASPLLSPYVHMHSWTGALLAISSSLPETIIAVVSLWVIQLLG